MASRRRSFYDDTSGPAATAAEAAPGTAGAEPARGRQRRRDSLDLQGDAYHDQVGDQPTGPSKSQLKRDAHDAQALGKKLIALPSSALKSFDLPEKLEDAIRHAQSIKSHEAGRRQLQYIGKLMRDVDPEPILERFAEREGTSKAATARMHLAERWRERLLADDSLVAELIDQVPQIEIQPLRAALRAAKREKGQNLPPKNYRELYRMIHEGLKRQAKGESSRDGSDDGDDDGDLGDD